MTRPPAVELTTAELMGRISALTRSAGKRAPTLTITCTEDRLIVDLDDAYLRNFILGTNRAITMRNTEQVDESHDDAPLFAIIDSLGHLTIDGDNLVVDHLIVTSDVPVQITNLTVRGHISIEQVIP